MQGVTSPSAADHNEDSGSTEHFRLSHYHAPYFSHFFLLKLIMKMNHVRRLSLLGVILAVAFSFESCVQKGTPIVVLGTPEFVPQSQPDSVIETGIGQDPKSGGIYLQWYSAQGAASYELFRADSTNAAGNPANFEVVANIAVSNALNDTSTVDLSGISAGVKYYYYLIAYLADGTSSSPSDTINYTLLLSPGLEYPVGNGIVSASGFNFKWNDRTGGGYTVIRVIDVSVIPSEYIWVTPRFQIYGGGNSTEPFNFDGHASSALISGHTYQWRVNRFDIDGTGRAYEGARSVWETFTVK